mmetsp:Transcript_1458/g.1992  ORF Transcript_1458/g.1992 Transcript_1458/m.1992 type:complete len:81 (+) Transcript_1458:2773-3015(+)
MGHHVLQMMLTTRVAATLAEKDTRCSNAVVIIAHVAGHLFVTSMDKLLIVIYCLVKFPGIAYATFALPRRDDEVITTLII